VKVHHLNCGSMRLLGIPLVCHVLLVETDRGLVLVDTGFGLRDIAAPAPRIGFSRRLGMPSLSLDPAETAARQVEALGLRREDVRHIVLTHFDFDHVGGLADFPHAQVHATAAEVRAATSRSTPTARARYRPAQWAHGPNLVEHAPDGESWRGFAAARELTGVAPGVVLLALPGHTAGHAGVAVDAGDHWVLHAGDAFYSAGTVDGRTRVPARIRAFEALMAVDRERLRHNQARLAELHGNPESDLVLVSSHDRATYESLRGPTR
jgi:glyoxylase-like metal-dependent hydrolase (beta-lactamase superfamily II)